MSQIRIQDLTFAYDGSYDNVFEDVNLSIDTNWKLGLVGRNGRGKTTLLRLLMGEFTYRGTINAQVEFGYFPYAIDPQEQRLTYELMDELCSGEDEWRWRREWNLLEITEDALYRPFCSLSPGERTKAQLAALFVRENRFLLIDEPTNHLDVQARDAVARYLNAKKGFILVSHDRKFLDGCVDHILAINKTGFETIHGNFSSWMRQKQQRDDFERAQNEKLAQQIGHLSAAAKRTAGWSDKIEATKIGQAVYDRGHVGHQAAKMMKRSKVIEQRRQTAIEDKQELLKDIEYASPLVLRPLLHHANMLVEARELSICYGGQPVFDKLDFTLMQNERVALSGPNGCGKSSMLKLIAGQDIPHTGELRVASQLKISYVPQDTSFLSGDLSDYARECRIDESLFKTILRKLDFLRVQFEKDMREFSAGQRKKVLIARSLCEQAHLYIWDEPLNFVDVYSRIQIEELIVEYAPTLLIVEHDRAFLENVATRQVEF
ncbi:ABC-F type ribosomal protection protein [Eubacteriales bacterium OttesenSCG-928-K08]|nr:ABC-F type ribosomal protection protein [Eubacteriales bacterium OttesenSCG-928-K08]